tara:strand:- start:187 stop:321 length:135 start_codon:yes stop_codon:yes gene_type:complete
MLVTPFNVDFVVQQPHYPATASMVDAVFLEADSNGAGLLFGKGG